MEKYLVGGAVRDTLLKIPVKEKDWVVVGSTPQEMLNIGYQQVGRDFPVFLHPDNHEEYALARTERKSGKGYTGFHCYTEPSITIEEDLYRRDLTINAMAYDKYGNLVDPYNGQKDIKLRLLRHVSHTFYEDPLRVLRVARFAARFSHMNFTIAPETLSLMKQMIYELPSLSPERIWIETKKALITDSPHVFFYTLRQCGALKILFPELNILFEIPKITIYDSNTNIGEYTMQKLAQIVTLTDDLAVRFSILCHNLDKSITFYNKIKQDHEFYNYETLGISPTKKLCNRLRIPHNISNLAKIISKYHRYLSNDQLCLPEILMKLFNAFDCWRQPKRIEQIILIEKSAILEYQDYNHNLHYQNKSFLYTAFTIANAIKVKNVIQDGFTGSKISLELYSRRLNALKIWNNKYRK